MLITDQATETHAEFLYETNLDTLATRDHLSLPPQAWVSQSIIVGLYWTNSGLH